MNNIHTNNLKSLEKKIKRKKKSHVRAMAFLEGQKSILHKLIEEGSIEKDTKNQPAAITLEWSDTLLSGEAVTYEKAEAAAQALGDGWRLPTRKELESLVVTSRYHPAIDIDVFPDTKSTWYWTSTPCAWDETAVWVVYFGDGYVGNYHRASLGCVRAVRSGQ